MTWPRWLVALFPRLAPRGQWADAVIVTDPRRNAALDAIYAQRVTWVRSIRPDAVIAPAREVTFRLWPARLRGPKEFDGLIGKVLSPNVIAGDIHGTLLVRELWKDNAALLAHESKHAITGESGHPDWLFPNG